MTGLPRVFFRHALLAVLCRVGLHQTVRTVPGAPGLLLCTDGCGRYHGRAW